MTFVITEGCVDIKDKACLDNCPVDCIYVGGRMSYINPNECIDCGACASVCPQEAIFFAADTPEPLGGYVDVNREFFEEIGSPGGAGALDLTDRDHPAISALP